MIIFMFVFMVVHLLVACLRLCLCLFVYAYFSSLIYFNLYVWFPFLCTLYIRCRNLQPNVARLYSFGNSDPGTNTALFWHQFRPDLTPYRARSDTMSSPIWHYIGLDLAPIAGSIWHQFRPRSGITRPPVWH